MAFMRAYVLPYQVVNTILLDRKVVYICVAFCPSIGATAFATFAELYLWLSSLWASRSVTADACKDTQTRALFGYTFRIGALAVLDESV